MPTLRAFIENRNSFIFYQTFCATHLNSRFSGENMVERLIQKLKKPHSACRRSFSGGTAAIVKHLTIMINLLISNKKSTNCIQHKMNKKGATNE
jgi:hypothetical protein